MAGRIKHKVLMPRAHALRRSQCHDAGMVDPVTAYQVASAGYKVGEFAYREADKRVADYAEREGIPRTQAWALVRQEAARRGDKALMDAADYADRHPLVANVAAAIVPGGRLILGGAQLRRWLTRRN